MHAANSMGLKCRFLMDTFGKVPKVGWQIDPFGHSATTPGLASLYGFDALFFGRADYQVRQCWCSDIMRSIDLGCC